MPTFTASAPAATNVLEASPVAIFPTTISNWCKRVFASFIFSNTVKAHPLEIFLVAGQLILLTQVALPLIAPLMSLLLTVLRLILFTLWTDMVSRKTLSSHQ